jgi:hypothetical protein
MYYFVNRMMYLVEKEDLIDEDDEFWGKDGKLTEMFKVSSKNDKKKFTQITNNKPTHPPTHTHTHTQEYHSHF